MAYNYGVSEDYYSTTDYIITYCSLLETFFKIS